MARRSKGKTADNDTAATVGYEAQLWQMADTLRGSMDAAEYKHVVLGLILFKGQGAVHFDGRKRQGLDSAEKSACLASVQQPIATNGA